MSTVYITEFISTFFPIFNADGIINEKFEKWVNDPTSKYYGLITSKEDVKEIWETNCNISRTLGIKFHYIIENYLKEKPSLTTNSSIKEDFLKFLKSKEFSINFEKINSIKILSEKEKVIKTLLNSNQNKNPIKTDLYTFFDTEVQHFFSFLHKHIFPYNFKVFLLEKTLSIKINKKVTLKGKIDCLFENDDSYFLIDWKRNSDDFKKLSKEEKTLSLLPSEPHIKFPDNKFGKAYLQLYFYIKMLKHNNLLNPSKKIKVGIVNFFSTKESYEYIKVKF